MQEGISWVLVIFEGHAPLEQEEVAQISAV